MNRRQFLFLSGGVAGSVALAHPIRSQTQSPLIHRADPEGLLELDLRAGRSSISLGGKRANLLSYNDQIPGPRLELRPGDQVRIQFTNQLNQNTNLHFHGLHIPPAGKADDIFRQIAPGETATYEFTLPLDHRSTLAWYHPHWHGLVAEQLFGGLAGLIVVRGNLDSIPELQSAQEEFLVLQDFDQDGTSNPMILVNGREGSTLAVNGTIKPSFKLATGDLLRLRIVNASPSRFYRLALEDHPLYLIGSDGGSLSAPVEVSDLLLSPGERADLLVQGIQKSGEYRLLNLPYFRGGMGMTESGRGMRGMMGSGMGGRFQTEASAAPQPLATITYSGSVDLKPLPSRLVAVEELSATDLSRRFVLNHGMTPGQGMAFLINGQAFDHQRVDTQVKLDTIEEWEIVNTGIMDHPFHLHTNPFQIISRNGQPEPYRAWKDTVLIPRGESVKIRVRFSDYPGKTVYHCHILDHEDLGMMGIIEIV